MKNQKLKIFFKTLFFRRNYGYLPTVLFFWFFLLMIAIDIGAKILDLLFFPESLPVGGHFYNTISQSESIFGMGDLTFTNGSITEFAYLLLRFKFIDNVLINNNFIQETCWFSFCSHTFTTTAKVIIYGYPLILLFVINFIGVKIYHRLMKNRLK